MNVLKSINKNKKNLTLLTGFIHSLTGRRWAGSSQMLLCLQTVRKCITNAMIDDLIETTFRGEEITVSYTKTTIKKIIMWWHTPKSSCASDQAVQKTKLLFDILCLCISTAKSKKEMIEPALLQFAHLILEHFDKLVRNPELWFPADQRMAGFP